jgi:very-short-patch-repair endonuclease
MQSRQTQSAEQLIELRARQHRSALNAVELRLWSSINAGKLGVVFRGQIVVGRYICDFVAPAARLIVEVEGRSHQLRRVADARRDRFLRRLGYRVLRLEAKLVLRNLPAALALIRAALSEPP